MNEDEIAVQKLTYDRIVAERDRIRGARAFFARQLGPLPAFAGISVAVVGAFSEEIEEELWLWLALVLFGLMVVASILYSRMPPYRELRSHRVAETRRPEGDGAATPTRWYAAECELERSIYGSQLERGALWWLPRRQVDGDLQQQLDKERFGVFLVQILFLLVITCLLLARLGL